MKTVLKLLNVVILLYSFTLISRNFSILIKKQTLFKIKKGILLLSRFTVYEVPTFVGTSYVYTYVSSIV